MLVLGIDPGCKGGFALVGDGVEPCAWAMPDTLTGILAALQHYPKPDLCCLESVHAMPGQGVSSCFTFGRGFGGLEALMAFKSIPVALVTPQRWQRAVLGRLPGDEGKRAVLNWARAQWPGLSLKASPRCKVDSDGLADALGLAFYGSKTFAWLE